MTKPKDIKVGVIGTGAVGGYFGGMLALSGIDVVFLSRNKTLKALKENGLTIKTGDKELNIKNAVFTDDASELSDCTYILFTVKSYDTQETISQIKPYVGEQAVIITPQNSVSNDVLLSQEFGKNRVIPGIAKIGVNTPQPGVINHLGLGTIEFGEYDGTKSERLLTLQSAFEKAGVQCVVNENIQLDRWKKFIWNCTFNIISAVTNLTLDRILEDPVLHNLCEQVMLEIIVVGKAEGINFGDEDIVAVRFEFTKKLGAFTTSTLEDVKKGKPIELNAFTGAIIELAKKHGIKVPVNETLYAVLRGITL